MEVNDSLSYLGMQIALGKGYVELDMIFYIDKALQNYKDIVEQPTPGTRELFEIGQSALLDDDARKQFHTTVARLLYLSKRVRPDIVTVVAFLCTRVKSPTVEDQQKLERLLGYLKCIREWKCRLQPQGVFSVVADVDASFAIHADSKSQTGCVIFVAGVPVYCSSKKQKCMTKSPTEAELVGLSDSLSFVEIFAEFLAFVIDQKTRPPVIYQDNTSVISLVTKGGGINRTKHLRARMNLVGEAVRERGLKVLYMPTEDMIADGFTKVLEGVKFGSFAKIVLGKRKCG